MHAITPANGSGLHGSPQGSERVPFRGADPMKTLLVGRHFLIREALRAIPLLSLLAAGIGVSTAKKRKKRESSQGRSAEKPA